MLTNKEKDEIREDIIFIERMNTGRDASYGTKDVYFKARELKKHQRLEKEVIKKKARESASASCSKFSFEDESTAESTVASSTDDEYAPPIKQKKKKIGSTLHLKPDILRNENVVMASSRCGTAHHWNLLLLLSCRHLAFLHFALG